MSNRSTSRSGGIRRTRRWVSDRKSEWLYLPMGDEPEGDHLPAFDEVIAGLARPALIGEATRA